MSYDLCFIGLGYIGLPTSALLARAGNKVLGVDNNPQRIREIQSGVKTTHEPGLSELLDDCLASGKLELSTTPHPSSTFIIAVPTPINESKSPDLDAVISATNSIIDFLEPGNLVVIESTCPPGTTRKMMDLVTSKRPELKDEIHFAYCPERVLPGNSLHELSQNDRVIGGVSEQAATMARDVYASFCTGRLDLTDAETAEMVKLAENAFRDVNIAFANELSILAERLEIDVWDVIEYANKHPRVNILRPGVGVGGHCIAVDPWFLANASPDDTKLIQTARNVNDQKPDWVVNRIEERISRNDDRAVMLLGITFKPDIDDLRSSPALEIATKLAQRNPDIAFSIWEPNIERLPEALDLANVSRTEKSPSEFDAQLICKLVEHAPFRSINQKTIGDSALLSFTSKTD